MCHVLQGFNSTKPSSMNTSSAPDVSKITAKFDASSTGFSTGAQSDAAGLLHHKAQENKAAHGSGMGLPNSAQDTVCFMSLFLGLQTERLMQYGPIGRPLALLTCAWSLPQWLSLDAE